MAQISAAFGNLAPLKAMASVVTADRHPTSLEDVLEIMVVKSPALALKKDLAVLVRASSNQPRAIAKADRAQFQELKSAFRRYQSTAIEDESDPFVVFNVPIASSWIRCYKLAPNARNLGLRRFVGIVHFGTGLVTQTHIEESAAATYGCLLSGRKEWEFFEKGKKEPVERYIQEQGETLYLPAGCMHRVKTLSNGAILIGETKITDASAAAFALHAGGFTTEESTTSDTTLKTKQSQLSLKQVLLSA
jgi:hypothetical protein